MKRKEAITPKPTDEKARMFVDYCLLKHQKSLSFVNSLQLIAQLTNLIMFSKANPENRADKPTKPNVCSLFVDRLTHSQTNSYQFTQ